MSISVNHVHIKTPDPKATARFYIDHLGATMIGEAGANGYRVNLHGLQLNITTLIPTQHRDQRYGLEHLAVSTDDYAGTLARFRASGAAVLEELMASGGRRVGFCQAPDGVQIEIIEQVGS
jgi:catechol 2,3-dioxygenase-like lactoylglutathione lyase family enzyme